MTTRQPTNADLLDELKGMDTRLSALEVWKISEDAAKKAVADYKLSEHDNFQTADSKEWLKIAKQVGMVLGIIITILYAYAATRGIHIQ